jgi:hypothetical protein
MTHFEAPKFLNGEYPETPEELSPAIQELDRLFRPMKRRVTHLIAPPDMWQTMYLWNDNPQGVVPLPTDRDYTRSIYGLQVLVGAKFDLLSAQTASLDHIDLQVWRNIYTRDSIGEAIQHSRGQFVGARANFIVIPAAFEQELLKYCREPQCAGHRIFNEKRDGMQFLIGDQFQILRGINGKEA